ncbi:MAG: hypothetical protein L3J96_02420, partial [Thermoplasmata archaeon]|nr:hypothetical protein [Thermoplasmata archaeon]
YSWHGLWGGRSPLPASSLSEECVTAAGNHSVWVGVVGSNCFHSNGTALTLSVRPAAGIAMPSSPVGSLGTSLYLWPIAVGLSVVMTIGLLAALPRRRGRYRGLRMVDESRSDRPRSWRRVPCPSRESSIAGPTSDPPTGSCSLSTSDTL